MKYFIKIFALLILITLVSCNTNKPKILIIGDSISLGYTPYVKRQLSGLYRVYRISENAMHTRKGLENINRWLAEEDWALIHFNWGLWDMCYRTTVGSNKYVKDKLNGKQDIPVEEYKKNLETLVSILKSTKSKLVFVTSTYVPKDEPGIFSEDVLRYNEAAKEIMNMHSIPVNDIYSESKEIHQRNGGGSDNAHFTQKGYKALADLIADFIKEQMSNTITKK